ncbi:MAG: hypothetical protein DSM106950_42190 [Stigonema ocellatum SAG 48.90 = DSM 106950]|nr:hypothetical protein [Stigonema ocellatum SAG 48.90 = DSM 106950]
MITTGIREELKRIQSELKKVFPASRHEVRDLPGGQRKWVYLKWQTIRERLDEVCPDWIIDYSEIQYLGNDAICRCGITILGVRKEAIASVPISILSSKGNEMTRESAADRLAAEAIKNSGEAWGVGRYLDDQQFTIRYLWENMGELDEKMQGEVRRLSEQYKIQVGVRQSVTPKAYKETGFIHAVAGISSESLITEGQRKRLWAIAKNELKLSDDQIKSALKHFGFEKTELITRDKYDAVIEHLKSLVRPSTQPDLYPANNDVVKQVRALTKHEPHWILAQCRHYGYDRPGMIPPTELEKLIADMCADWAVGVGVIGDRENAHTSIQGALAFAIAAGQPILGAAIEWLNRHQLEVST